MKPPNPPKRHHYIPEFMLEGWVHQETLFRYTKPQPDLVHLKQVVPKSAGFKEI